MALVAPGKLYLTCGVVSSWVAGVVSCYHPALKLLRVPALGASGAVLGLVSYATLSQPNLELAIIFLPMFSFPAINMLAGLVCFDLVGLVLGWRALGHAAHLTGVATGAGFYYGGLEAAQLYKRQVRMKVDMARRWYRDKMRRN